MKEQSLSFTSAATLCQFIRDIQLRQFLLLGKMSVLVAAFPAETIQLAITRYGATSIDTPEEAMTLIERTETGLPYSLSA